MRLSFVWRVPHDMSGYMLLNFVETEVRCGLSVPLRRLMSMANLILRAFQILTITLFMDNHASILSESVSPDIVVSLSSQLNDCCQTLASHIGSCFMIFSLALLVASQLSVLIALPFTPSYFLRIVRSNLYAAWLNLNEVVWRMPPEQYKQYTHNGELSSVDRGYILLWPSVASRPPRCNLFF